MFELSGVNCSQYGRTVEWQRKDSDSKSEVCGVRRFWIHPGTKLRVILAPVPRLL